MKLYISLVFENCATDLTPHFLTKGWRKWPKCCKKMRFVYTFEDYHWSVREIWHVTLQTLSSNQDLSSMLSLLAKRSHMNRL